MYTIESGRIAQLGHEFAGKMRANFGDLTMPVSAVRHRLGRAAFLNTLYPKAQLKGFDIIDVADPKNFAALTEPEAHGRTFAVMDAKQRVRMGIITDRTQSGELHLTCLQGLGVPIDQFHGASAFDRTMLEVGELLQRPGAGSKAADGTRATASEIGHTMLGLSALTDPWALLSLQPPLQHDVHAWSEDKIHGGLYRPAIGIARALTRREVGSAFTALSDHERVDVGFGQEIALCMPSPVLWLVTHESMTDERESSKLGVTPAELATGMAIATARSSLEHYDRSLDDQTMWIMEMMSAHRPPTS